MRICKSTKTADESFKRFLEQDKNFKDYKEWRSCHINGFEDDILDIHTFIKTTPKIESPEEKPFLQTFLNSNHEDLVDMRLRAKGKNILSYLATKTATGLYDKLLSRNTEDAMDAANKPSDERSEEDKRKIKKASNTMKLNIRKLVGESKKEFDEKADALEAMEVAGTESGGNPKKLTLSESLDLLKKVVNDEKLKKIMSLVGKFQNFAKHKLLTRTEGIGAIVGVELGDDIPNLLPSELGMLVDEDFKSLKELQLIQKQLFQYRKMDKTPKSKGPFIVCLDESGSMAKQDRLCQSKAFLFGMYEIAKAEKRKMKVISFGGRNETFSKTINNDKDLMVMVESFMKSRSTNFQTPLELAMDDISSGNWEKSDIVFVTDDASNSFDSGFLESFKDFKNKTNTKVVSLCLAKSTRVVKLFSDEVVKNFEEILVKVV